MKIYILGPIKFILIQLFSGTMINQTLLMPSRQIPHSIKQQNYPKFKPHTQVHPSVPCIRRSF